MLVIVRQHGRVSGAVGAMELTAHTRKSADRGARRAAKVEAVNIPTTHIVRKGMKKPSSIRHSGLITLASLAFAVSTLSACSSSTDGSAGNTSCTAPALSGSPAGSTGTASISGTGTLPDGIANGLELQVLLDQGNFSTGVLPDDLFANDRVCGKTFQYNVTKIEAGTYTLTFEVNDPNSTNFKTLFAGTAPSSFTVTDGQALKQDTTFQLTPM